MRHRVSGVIVLLMFLASCREEGPVSPFVQDGGVTEFMSVSSVFEKPTDQGMKARRYFNVLEHVKFGRTRASARLVDRAARAFAGDNDGWFPRVVQDRNAAGRTLIDYLPAGRMLKNAYTQIPDLPHDGAANATGAVAYAVIELNGNPVGYVVSAMGNTTDQQYHIIRKPD